jgi:hypothetical protein
VSTVTRANWLQSERVRRIAMPVAICIGAGVVMVLWYLSEPGDSQVEVRFTNLQDVVGTQQDLWPFFGVPCPSDDEQAGKMGQERAAR